MVCAEQADQSIAKQPSSAITLRPLMHPASITPTPQRDAIFRALKDSGQVLELQTTGMSMAPMIRESSTVTVCFGPPDQVLEGDIILFSLDERLVLHRVLSIMRDGGARLFVEKGDHQPFSSTVHERDYLGYVTLIQTGGRNVETRSPRGRAAARRLRGWSRFERRLYTVKTRLFGARPTVPGKLWIAAGRLARKILHRHGTTHRE